MCHYLEDILSFRAALLVVEKKVPEIRRLLQSKASWEEDMDLKIALMSDEELDFLYEKYAEVEEKLYRFNPNEEFGTVNTMFPEDMRGN